MPLPDGQATVAVDATGLAPGAISTFFVTCANERGDGCTWRHWLKWTIVVDIDHRVILAQTARRGPTHDGAIWRPLVSTAPARVPIGVVLADAACDRERNHQHVRQTLQAQSIIPAKRGGANWRIQGRRAQMRQAFPADLYSRRALIERLISAVKRKLSARAPGRSLQTQDLQALRLGIADNIYRLQCFALPQVLRMSIEPSYFKILSASAKLAA